jgi:hypothetical protein
MAVCWNMTPCRVVINMTHKHADVGKFVPLRVVFHMPCVTCMKNDDLGCGETIHILSQQCSSLGHKALIGVGRINSPA